jgi:hypothetical protein
VIESLISSRACEALVAVLARFSRSTDARQSSTLAGLLQPSILSYNERSLTASKPPRWLTGSLDYGNYFRSGLKVLRNSLNFSERVSESGNV